MSINIENLYKKYDRSFIYENMMGPNSIIILEELLSEIELNKKMRILDLGCGRGLTSVFLAKEYGVQVFAVDLWTSPSENFERFRQQGLDDLIIPIYADALNLPFAEKYFDAVISVDSYHYFGNNDTYFKKNLKPLIKDNGIIAIAFPGMKCEVHENIPEEMKPFWDTESLEMWQSIKWWKNKFSDYLSYFKIEEMQCFDSAWNEWLSTSNPYAIGDRDMMKTDGGKYMNLIKITGRVK